MSTQTPRFTLLPEGFHGDKYLQTLVDVLLSEAVNFIETGTNVGSTLLYVAKRFPKVSCLSCEPDAEAFAQAQANTRLASNVTLFHENSVTFLQRLPERRPGCQKLRTVFWLDAHCYGHGWPLPTEVNFIGAQFEEAWVLIDDCEVPGRRDFAFHASPGEHCSITAVLQALPPDQKHRLWRPAYREHTSQFHPLTGWCLLALGRAATAADRLLAKLPPGLISEHFVAPAGNT